MEITPTKFYFIVKYSHTAICNHICKKKKKNNNLSLPAKADLHSHKACYFEFECATWYVGSRPQGDDTPVWQLSIP